jgi:hypothetical protein
LWGDYGLILIHGVALRRGDTPHDRLLDREAPLLLERTGPFIPPITIPHSGCIVVSDGFRLTLESSCPAVFQFKPVVKSHIVVSDWHTWDWDAEDPREVPSGGEPDEYLAQPHSDEAASQMGDVWELIVEKGAWLDTDVRRAPWDYDLRIHLDSWNGSDLFYGEKDDASSGQWLIVTETGRARLQELSGEWLSFEETLAK